MKTNPAPFLPHALLSLGRVMCALLFSLSAAPCAAAASAETPNIVLIFVDDLGDGDVSPFGNQKLKTPHIEKLAAQGMKFTSFYATPVCSMSRACLLTGSYNVRVSVPGVLFPPSNTGLHPDEITLAEIVKPQGYATTCIGKWHLGHRELFLPVKQGFDSYFGFPYSNDMSLDTQNAVFANACAFRNGMDEKKARGKGHPLFSLTTNRSLALSGWA